jgi:uncharacterized UPF0160 family protein
MIGLKLQRPFIDNNGKVYEHLERHYAEDENGVKYKIRQVETGVIYDEAIDLYPCKYTYEATRELVEEVVDEPRNEFVEKNG